MRMKAFCYIRRAARSLLISMGIVLLGMVGSAAADTMNLSWTFGGTFDNATNIDVNADGIQAGISSYEVEEAAFGNSTGTGIYEWVITDPTGECPGGTAVINAAEEMGYGRDTGTAPNGDQIYTYTLTATSCADGEGRFANEGTSRVYGGTGQFAGATGDIQATNTGHWQAYDPVSMQGFGSFTGTSTGTLDIPNFNAEDGDGAGDGDSGDDAGSTGPDCNGDGVVNGLDLLGIGCDS